MNQYIGSQYPPYDYSLVNDLKQYIQDELTDSAYYAELATKAPTPRARMLIQELGADERRHAQSFMRAYCMLTGMVCQPGSIPAPDLPEYEEALKQRILAETKDYIKYGGKYLMVPLILASS